MLIIHNGDALATLRTMADASIQCVVTSPPYWSLRDYGVEGQLGLEATYPEYVKKMVAVFAEIHRVLHPSGTCWVNLGDTYATDGLRGRQTPVQSMHHDRAATTATHSARAKRTPHRDNAQPGLKSKDLCGIPWRVAFALQEWGWYLRADIIWHKRNPLPESITDRPARCHEYLFLLTKSARYQYDAEAVKERRAAAGHHAEPATASMNGTAPCAGRNCRSVWTLSAPGYDGAHHATFPPALVRPCILAGARPGQMVMDPFAGAGTTGLVALELGRRAVLIEINPEYCRQIEKRCAITPGLPLG